MNTANPLTSDSCFSSHGVCTRYVWSVSFTVEKHTYVDMVTLFPQCHACSFTSSDQNKIVHTLLVSCFLFLARWCFLRILYCFFLAVMETLLSISLECSRRLIVKACTLPDVAKAGAPCAFLVNPCNWRLVGRGGRTNVLVNKSAGPCLEKTSLQGRKRARTAEPIPVKVR